MEMAEMVGTLNRWVVCSATNYFYYNRETLLTRVCVRWACFKLTLDLNNTKYTHTALWGVLEFITHGIINDIIMCSGPWVYFCDFIVYWFMLLLTASTCIFIPSPAWQHTPDSADCMHCYYNKEWNCVRNVSVTVSDVTSFPVCIGLEWGCVRCSLIPRLCWNEAVSE